MIGSHFVNERRPLGPTHFYVLLALASSRVCAASDALAARRQSDNSTVLFYSTCSLYNSDDWDESDDRLPSLWRVRGVGWAWARGQRRDEWRELRTEKAEVRQRARAHRAPPLHFTPLRSRTTRRAALHLMNVSERADLFITPSTLQPAGVWVQLRRVHCCPPTFDFTTNPCRIAARCEHEFLLRTSRSLLECVHVCENERCVRWAPRI